MKIAANIGLPIAPQEYNASNEQTARRTVEHALADMRQDVSDGHEMKDKSASLALRRFQFLLMGASSG